MSAIGDRFVVTARPKAKIAEDQAAALEAELKEELLEEAAFLFVNARLVHFWSEINVVTGLVSAFHGLIEHDGPRC